MQRHNIIVLLVTLSVIGSCSHPTDPSVPPRKDPRTYSWTIDTIYLPNSFQTLMTCIWGSSPQDVYVTGHNSNNPGQMYHYDGTSWKEVPLYRQNGGVIDIYVDMQELIGFSPSDVWAVGQGFFGDGGHIIHYDGKNWTTVPCPYVKEVETFTCIGGTGSNNIWVGGAASSSLYHYNGSVWTKDSLPVFSPSSSKTGDSFFFRSIKSDKQGNMFAIATMHYQVERVAEIYYFFTYSNDRWALIDSATVTLGLIEHKWGYTDLWVSPSNSVYSASGDVYRRSGEAWTRLYDGEINLHSIYGNSDENIFAVGPFGTILHFNGTDWKKVSAYSATNLHYGGIWTDGTEVFIVGYISGYPMKSVVIHGK